MPVARANETITMAAITKPVTRLRGQWPPRTRNGPRDMCRASFRGARTPEQRQLWAEKWAEHLSGRVIQEGRPRRNGASGAEAGSRQAL
jgi:hypothetical protein